MIRTATQESVRFCTLPEQLSRYLVALCSSSHTIEGFCSFNVGRLKVDRSAYLVVYHLNADHLKGTTCNLSSVFEERLRYDSLTPITW